MADMLNPPIKVKSIEDLVETTVIQPNWWFRVIDASREPGDRTLKVSAQTIHDYFSVPGPPGPQGASAYDAAVAGGYVGTQGQWLASLKGTPGTAGTNGLNGKSAYEIAQAAGYSGTSDQWLASLRGPQGPIGVANCRNARVPIGSGLLAANAVQTLTVTWPTPFADPNYTVSFGWQRPAGVSLGGVRVEILDSPNQPGITKTGVTLQVINGVVAFSMANVILHVTATHDATS